MKFPIKLSSTSDIRSGILFLLTNKVPTVKIRFNENVILIQTVCKFQESMVNFVLDILLKCRLRRPNALLYFESVPDGYLKCSFNNI